MILKLEHQRYTVHLDKRLPYEIADYVVFN